MNWKEFLEVKKNKIDLAITLLWLITILVTLTNFLNFVEKRQGVVLPDPILSLFNPINLTWIIFALIYISIIIGVATLFKDPKRLIFTLQLYTLMVTVRIIAMYLVPLDPPLKMITLNDPFVQFFGTGQTLTKDLFFSGHTATLFILFLVSENRKFKLVFLITTIAIAVLVLLQHVHYSIDVFAAIFFTYACYKLLIKINPV
jgi:membrane-associated phospholipid phosphatase